MLAAGKSADPFGWKALRGSMGSALRLPVDRVDDTESAVAEARARGCRIVATVPRHYIVRTSWVIGDGKNFVRTMLSLAERGVNPSVVNDQIGRLTFTSEIARAIRHLIETRAPYGTYNVSGSGSPGSWADVARRTFALAGQDPDRVTGISTEAYFADAAGPVAPRPRGSVLDLSKIESTGFVPADADDMLADYVAAEARTAVTT